MKGTHKTSHALGSKQKQSFEKAWERHTCWSWRALWKDKRQLGFAMGIQTLASKLFWGIFVLPHNTDAGKCYFRILPVAPLVAQLVKNPPAIWETWVWSLCWEDTLEEGMATHFSILFFFLINFFNWRIIALQNFVVFCLENPHGQRSLAGCSPWGCKESDNTEWLSTAHSLVASRISSTKQTVSTSTGEPQAEQQAGRRHSPTLQQVYCSKPQEPTATLWSGPVQQRI